MESVNWNLFWNSFFNSNFASGLLGSFIAFLGTWMITFYSLRKQQRTYEKNIIDEREYHLKIENAERKKQEKVALTSIKRELFINITYLKYLIGAMETDGLEFVDFTINTELDYMLKGSKWDKYDDFVETIEEIDYTSELGGFYLNIYTNSRMHLLDKERAEKMLIQAEELLFKLSESLIPYK